MNSSQSRHQKWYIKDSEALPENDPSFLCHVCKHINFRFLLFECSILQMFEEIPLDSLSNILDRQYCAFCRLIKHTLDNTYGVDSLLTEHQGQAVKLSMISTSDSYDESLPRQLLLWIKPNPLDNGKTPPLEIQHIEEGKWFEGSGLGRLIQLDEMDYLLALLWVRVCRKGLGLHKDYPSERDGHRLPDGFRLIDTKENCIVQFPSDSSLDYVTLSYVWGKDQAIKLFSTNYEELKKKQALDDKQLLSNFGCRLPQTIRDAMNLVPKLAERYLWVDALCIFQDDDPDNKDRETQISAMDRIYGSSVLTIAAAYGCDADAGLPGVRPSSRSVIQEVETIQGLRLANRPWPFSKGVEQSTWNARAWTFQERVLSKRILFVSQQQLFFKCDHLPGRVAEDLDTKLRSRRPQTHPMDDTGKDIVPLRWSINILTYQKTVESFSSRDISWPEDILNAFEGIVQKVKEPLFRSGFLYGLPQSELDYCLLWEPSGSGSVFERRVAKKTGLPIFPSWSWAGWVGQVHYTWQERLSRVEWEDESGRTFTLDDCRAPNSKDLKAESSSDWRKDWTEKKTDWGFRYFSHSSNPDVWFRNPTAPESERACLGPKCCPATDTLRFRAKTIGLDCCGEWSLPENTKGPLWSFNLTDKEEHLVGYFRVPVQIVPTMNKTKLDMVLIARTQHSLTYKDIKARKDPSLDEAPLSFSSDAGTKIAEPPAYKPLEKYVDEDDVTTETNFFPDEVSNENAQWGLPFDRQRYDAYKPFCLYEFLVVQWYGSVAYRIGIGKIHIDAWAKLEDTPKKKTITLG